MSPFAVIPASYLFLRRGDAVLLQLRQNTGYMDGYWTAGAAGHIELGETAAQAAIREAREELGIEISLPALTSVAVMQRTDGTDNPREQRVDWSFTCNAWKNDPAIMEPAKCAELRWFDLSDLPEQVPNYERMALDVARCGQVATLLDVGF